MKFLIYGINFAPELTGIGKYTGEMAVFLARQGHQVRVVTAPPYYPAWSVGQPYSANEYKNETWEGVEVFRCPLYVPRKATGLKRVVHLLSFVASSLPRLLQQAFWKPDVVFTVAPSIFSAPLALVAGLLSGGKTWLHIQDFELDAAFNLGIIKGSPVLYRLAAKFESALLRGFDCVSTISGKMVERLEQKGVTPEKIAFFPNWADTEHIFPKSGTNGLRQELRIGEDKFVVLYSGNMGRKQGIEILVQAAERLRARPDIQFILCGEGVAKAELVQQSAGLPNVSFFPLQPVERLNDLLNLADVHVLPQKASAADLVMPSKLTGILASGRPVIATSLPGTELYSVVSKVGVTVPPDQVDALTSSILRMVDDCEGRVQLGMRGRKFVEENWARNRVLKGFIEKAESLAGKSRKLNVDPHSQSASI